MWLSASESLARATLTMATALELADAGTFQLAATGGWDPAADVNPDSRITSLGCAHDPAGGGWQHRIMTKRMQRYVHEKNRIPR